MEQKKIGNIILKLRKEKNMTQQELGDLLGVSPKTISKWECGNGLPDITLLNKISKELGITIDELLEGRKKDKKSKNKRNKNIIIIAIALIIITLIISILLIKYEFKKSQNPKKEDDACTVIRTYDIKNIGLSNDENYIYITITEYQVEGVFTVKLPKSISNDLEENKSYEFTFRTDKDYEAPDALFNNSEVINIKYTSKIGMERTSISHCN